MTIRETRTTPAPRIGGAALPSIRRASFAMAVLLLVQFGLTLIVIALALIIRAATTRHGGIIALAVLGMAALTSAAINGTRFVGTGQNGASMAMALAWAVAMLCYLSLLFITGRNRAGQQ